MLEKPKLNQLKRERIELMMKQPVTPHELKRRQFEFPSSEQRLIEAE
jgi:hypothetical protein